MSAAKPALQVQSRVNGLVIALPNHQNIAGLAKHFNTRGDNELVFADVKTTGRRRAPSGESMRIGSPAEEPGEAAARAPRKARGAAPAADGSDLA